MTRALAMALVAACVLIAGASGSLEGAEKEVSEIAAWHRTRVPRLAEQVALVSFVDPTGDLTSHLHIPADGRRMSDWEFIQGCIMDGVSEQSRRIISNWYDAISYASQAVLRNKAAAVSYDQLAEIQRRIVGHDASLSGLRDPSSDQAVIGFLELLNGGLESVSKMSSLEERVVEASKLAAWSMLTLRELHPFVDGNRRVMEVINSVIMQASGVTRFAFRVHSCDAGWGFPEMSRRMMNRSEVVGSEELTRFVIAKLWGAWSSAAEVDRLQLALHPSRLHKLFSAVKAALYPF